MYNTNCREFVMLAWFYFPGVRHKVCDITLWNLYCECYLASSSLFPFLGVRPLFMWGHIQLWFLLLGPSLRSGSFLYTRSEIVTLNILHIIYIIMGDLSKDNSDIPLSFVFPFFSFSSWQFSVQNCKLIKFFFCLMNKHNEVGSNYYNSVRTSRKHNYSPTTEYPVQH